MRRAHGEVAVRTSDHFDQLPDELVLDILARLNSTTLCCAAAVNRRLFRLANAYAYDLVHRKVGLPAQVGVATWDDVAPVKR